jgi:hypothetical protein
MVPLPGPCGARQSFRRAARPRLVGHRPRADGLRPLHRRVRQRDRPIKLCRTSRRRKLHEPREFPRERWASLLKTSDGGTGPTSERRPWRFRGSATERSAARETISASSTRWSSPSPGLPRRECGGGGNAPSKQFWRSMPPPPAQKQSSRCLIRDDRRRATTKLQPRADGLRRQNSKRPKLRSRLANALPISGEGRTGWSMVPLPGPRGGRQFT